MSRNRGIWVSVSLLLGLIALVWLRQSGPEGAGFLPECQFHRFTGLVCPGCGMTRATHAALHGRFGEAFRFNPVGVIVLPVLAGVVGCFLPSWVRGERQMPFFRMNSRAVWCLAVSVLVFWILRNLPIWPFTLLAPP
jgi:hypothetical protein